MEFFRHAQSEWEPARIVIEFSGGNAPSKRRIESKLVAWFKQRDEGSTCPCSLTFLNVTTTGNRSEILCERLCESCLETLVDDLPSVIDGLTKMEFGYPTLPESSAISFIQIEDQNVEFEDGHKEHVDPFFITKRPVSIEVFADFVDRVAYTTDAERDGSLETWRSNEMNSDDPRGTKSSQPVVLISFNDAEMFCKSNNFRLPSEAEWMAASLVDPKLYEPEIVSEAIYRASRSDNALQEIGDEYTGSCEEGGRVIVRRGPKWARDTTWKKQVDYNRIAIDRNLYEGYFTFRVCKDRRNVK
jgi:hypothetical protein